MDIHAGYESLRNEVAAARDHIRSKWIAGSDEESLYKGSAILFSALMFRPQFLFLGRRLRKLSYGSPANLDCVLPFHAHLNSVTANNIAWSKVAIPFVNHMAIRLNRNP